MPLAWSRAFGEEAMPGAPSAAASAIDARLGQPGLLWIWQDAAGEPVSMAYRSRPAGGVVRVSGVYTPPEQRGRGYASACTAAVSQHALNHGATVCMLYADLANPTSNKIYQAIGYRPVEDQQEWEFTPTAGSPGSAAGSGSGAADPDPDRPR
jgi:predicted GNAT family acetyltransferase